MIRVLIVDDHPAMRAGLTAVLRAEPGIVPVGAVPSAHELVEALERTLPDVVVLDYHLPSDDGLMVCRRLKHRASQPRVLLYSGYADASLALPAILAGADGLLNKSAPAAELYDALRSVARGERVLPPVSPDLLESAAAVLAPEDLPILSMLRNGESLQDTARTLRLDMTSATRRLDAMIARLRVEIPAPAPSAA
jgi:DNA-binding NarL/FixJ family response regulator